MNESTERLILSRQRFAAGVEEARTIQTWAIGLLAGLKAISDGRKRPQVEADAILANVHAMNENITQLAQALTAPRTVELQRDEFGRPTGAVTRVGA